MITKVIIYIASNQGFFSVNVLKLKCLNIVIPRIIAMIIAAGLKRLLFMIFIIKDSNCTVKKKAIKQLLFLPAV
jgi:hypothetical protein